MYRRGMIELAILGGLTLGCSDAPRGRFAAFDDLVEEHIAQHGLAGATAVILTEEQGIVHLRGYGDFAPDRVMLVASSSKVVSAGLLLALADQGVVDLDAPIGDHVGAWGDQKAHVTLAQLLSNSSGMPGLLEDAIYPAYICNVIPEGTLTDCAEEIYVADDVDDRVPPDTEFRYGGAQWQLAGGVAEVASGKTWHQLFDEVYVQSCGLSSSGYQNHFLNQTFDPSVPGGLTYPDFFDGDPATLGPTDNPSIEGGMYTTVTDYAQILLMHLRGGMCGDQRVLSEEAVLRMQEDRIADVYDGTTKEDPRLPTLPGYGLGWWIARDAPIISDGGAYGATPWIDVDARYAAMWIIEADASKGAAFREAAIPVVREALGL